MIVRGKKFAAANILSYRKRKALCRYNVDRACDRVNEIRKKRIMTLPNLFRCLRAIDDYYEMKKLTLCCFGSFPVLLSL